MEGLNALNEAKIKLKELIGELLQATSNGTLNGFNYIMWCGDWTILTKDEELCTVPLTMAKLDYVVTLKTLLSRQMRKMNRFYSCRDSEIPPIFR